MRKFIAIAVTCTALVACNRSGLEAKNPAIVALTAEQVTLAETNAKRHAATVNGCLAESMSPAWAVCGVVRKGEPMMLSCPYTTVEDVETPACIRADLAAKPVAVVPPASEPSP